MRRILIIMKNNCILWNSRVFCASLDAIALKCWMMFCIFCCPPPRDSLFRGWRQLFFVSSNNIPYIIIIWFLFPNVIFIILLSHCQPRWLQTRLSYNVFVGGGFCHKKFHFCAYIITPEILLLKLRLVDEWCNEYWGESSMFIVARECRNSVRSNIFI